MKRIVISLMLISVLLSSGLYAGGPSFRRRPERRNSTLFENVTLEKTILIKPELIRVRRNNVIVRKETGVRPARFYEYSFTKSDFLKKFPNGVSGPVKVKIKIYKKKIHTWYPSDPGAAYPIGGFKTITYFAKIFITLQ